MGNVVLLVNGQQFPNGRFCLGKACAPIPRMAIPFGYWRWNVKSKPITPNIMQNLTSDEIEADMWQGWNEQLRLFLLMPDNRTVWAKDKTEALKFSRSATEAFEVKQERN